MYSKSLFVKYSAVSNLSVAELLFATPIDGLRMSLTTAVAQSHLHSHKSKEAKLQNRCSYIRLMKSTRLHLIVLISVDLLVCLSIKCQIADSFESTSQSRLKGINLHGFVESGNNQLDQSIYTNGFQSFIRNGVLQTDSQTTRMHSVPRNRKTALSAIVGPESSTAISLILGNNAKLSMIMALTHVLLGSLGTPTVAKAIRSWYNKIDKPSWTPPNRIFAPTWTLLYTFMGIAYSRIIQQLNLSIFSTWNNPISIMWMLHLFLNITWAPIFFGLKQLRVGLYINYGLLLSLCCIILPWYRKIDLLASNMLVPYALWLMYATSLNRSICLRNPGPYNTAKFYSDLLELQQKATIYANS